MLSRFHLIPERNEQTDRQICYINIARQYADARSKLRSSYCTIEVNYTDRHEASRGLFATAELLVIVINNWTTWNIEISDLILKTKCFVQIEVPRLSSTAVRVETWGKDLAQWSKVEGYRGEGSLLQQSQSDPRIFYSGGVMFSTGLSARPFVRPFVTKLVNTIFFKMNDRFCCKLAQVIRGAKRWNDQVWGWGGQRSRSQEAKVRFGGLAEASSFSTTLVE